MQFSTISPNHLSESLSAVTIIDVREPNEFKTASIDGSILIPLGEIATRLSDIPATSPVVMMCLTGARSAQAAAFLAKRGYTNISNLAGGITAWESAGLTVSTSGSLTSRDRERYARHLALPSFGADGQQKLLDASVLVVGAGGLGSPAAEPVPRSGEPGLQPGRFRPILAFVA